VHGSLAISLHGQFVTQAALTRPGSVTDMFQLRHANPMVVGLLITLAPCVVICLNISIRGLSFSVLFHNFLNFYRRGSLA